VGGRGSSEPGGGGGGGGGGGVGGGGGAKRWCTWGGGGVGGDSRLIMGGVLTLVCSCRGKEVRKGPQLPTVGVRLDPSVGVSECRAGGGAWVGTGGVVGAVGEGGGGVQTSLR